MFGIGGGEFLFIMIVALMFFGSDKIPEIARTLGKGMAQLRNATNDVRNEIQKGMNETGIARDIEQAKEGFTKMINQAHEQTGLKSDLDEIRANFARMNADMQQTVQDAAAAANETPKSIAEPQIPEIAETPQPESDGPIKRQS
jgi:sec-independent protein translocase protein TatA